MESFKFGVCSRATHCFCKLKDASKILQGALEMFLSALKALQDDWIKIASSFLQKMLPNNINCTRVFWKMYVTKSLFSRGPRRIQDAPSAFSTLQDGPMTLQNSWKAHQDGSDAFSNTSKTLSKGDSQPTTNYQQPTTNKHNNNNNINESAATPTTTITTTLTITLATTTATTATQHRIHNTINTEPLYVVV